MQKLQLAGVELYFEDLPRARAFYKDVLGLKIADEMPGHYAKFDGGASFICVERKGSESYPSQDKAVLFFEVEDVAAALASFGPERVVQSGPSQSGPPTWAVIHDPEGHNILLLQTDVSSRREKA
jgi:predicted enzyme related to lactoylglutathione lyase